MSHKEIETYGLYPQYVSNTKERELRITKVKKWEKHTHKYRMCLTEAD